MKNVGISYKRVELVELVEGVELVELGNWLFVELVIVEAHGIGSKFCGMKLVNW